MANRVGLIVTKVLKKAKKLGQHDIQNDDLIAEMESIQTELCRKFIAIKTLKTIPLVAGQVTYDLTALGIYKVKEFIKPATWCHPLILTHDSQVWSNYVSGIYNDNTQPLYGYIWSGVLNVIPAPSVSENITCFAYALPSVALTYEGDPETPAEFDNCYENELMFRIFGDKLGHQLYLDRAREISLENFKESVSGVIKVQSTSDILGF